MLLEFSRAKRFAIERRAAPAGAVKRKMDAWLAELRANRLLLEAVEAGLLPRHLDSFGGKESKECVLHALGRIFSERFVQNPSVIGVDVKRKLLPLIQPRYALLRDSIHHGLDCLHVGRVIFPVGILHSTRGDVFPEESIIGFHPVLSVGTRGASDAECDHKEEAREYFHVSISHCGNC